MDTGWLDVLPSLSPSRLIRQSPIPSSFHQNQLSSYSYSSNMAAADDAKGAYSKFGLPVLYRILGPCLYCTFTLSVRLSFGQISSCYSIKSVQYVVGCITYFSASVREGKRAFDSRRVINLCKSQHGAFLLVMYSMEY